MSLLFNVSIDAMVSILVDEGAVFRFADDSVVIVQGGTREETIKS